MSDLIKYTPMFESFEKQAHEIMTAMEYPSAADVNFIRTYYDLVQTMLEHIIEMKLDETGDEG